MKNFIKKFILFLFPFLCYAGGNATSNPKLEVVFCLDLSGSTNGLIEDFRNNYWQLLKNVSAKTNQSLRVGFIGYARPSFGATSSYVKIFSDLTTDFESISHSINQLNPNIEKGDQFIPNVIYTAALGLNWTKDVSTKKIIFLIGNGKVQLGKFDFRKGCELSKENNIVIYPVNCLQKTVAPVDVALWQSIAKITGGEFESIKVSGKERTYAIAGIDEHILSLNKKLSSTFVYYGYDGLKRFKMMNQTDTFCMRISPDAFYARTQMKLSNDYYEKATAWDLVSQLKVKQPDFNTIDRKSLPDSLQNLDVKKLSTILKTKKDERDYLTTQLKNSINRIKFKTEFDCQLDSILNSTLRKVSL